jgi:hypothetical protein
MHALGKATGTIVRGVQLPSQYLAALLELAVSQAVPVVFQPKPV